MLQVTAAISSNAELSATVALLTDGRFSGATRGFTAATLRLKPLSRPYRSGP